MFKKILLSAYALIFGFFGFLAGGLFQSSTLWIITAIGLIPIGIVAMVKAEALIFPAWPAILLPLALIGTMWATHIQFFGIAHLF